MNITDIIRERRSVRTFDASRPVSDEDIDKLRDAIKAATSPFGGSYKIELQKFDLKGPQKPSTYGTIEGASWYLLMGIHDDLMSAISAGYAMEGVVLKATSLGLGTCWMALTFKGSDFTRDVTMPDGVPLRIISPVGYPAARRRVMESLTRVTLGSANRKPMDAMFSQVSFEQPVSQDSRFYTALSMMRLAPSAKNSQPWRALVDGDTVYFYFEQKTEAAALDLGIGLCHFDLALQSEGLAGEWTVGETAPAHDGYIPAVKFSLKK